MRVNGPLWTVGHGRQNLPQAPARIVEKASAASALTREHQDETPQRHKARAPLRVELVCQDETSRFDPFRDAPTLKPTFVAQLLGQVMTAETATPSAQAAYRRAPAAARPLNRLVNRLG